jgi:hypothetical protein
VYIEESKMEIHRTGKNRGVFEKSEDLEFATGTWNILWIVLKPNATEIACTINPKFILRIAFVFVKIYFRIFPCR